MSRIGHTSFATLLLLLTHLVALGQQDCFDAINVCSANFVQNNSFSGVGSEQELAPATTCLGNGEVNSAWYMFTVYQSGNLQFQLDPLNANDDYDFALFSLTNDSCAGILAGSNTPISCNYSADAGATGISNGAIGNNNGSSQSNQNAPVAVTQGETYALLVSNFTSSQNGYSLNFSGSASVVDDAWAMPDSVSLGIVCNPRQVLLFFDEEFNCASIAGFSEITVTGPSTVTVNQVVGIACNDGLTDQIRIRFTNKIQVLGTYTITIGLGSDGDTFSDGCGNEVPNGTSFTFTVSQIGPDVSAINLVHSSCGLDEGSAEAVVTGGTSPFTYNWNSSPSQNTPVATGLAPGTYRIRVTDANGCQEQVNVTILNDTPFDLTNRSTTSTSCNGVADGTAQLIPTGGVLPYAIEWNTTPPQFGQNASGLPSGNIDVTVTDATGCEEQIQMNIPQPPAIALDVATVRPDCSFFNGSITLTASGGSGAFNYSWNTVPVQNTSTAIDLFAGVYVASVSDQNGCSVTTQVILTNSFAPNTTVEDRISDCGQGVGSATIVPTSGTGPYTYQWNTSPPQNTETASGLTVGDYFATITDAAGCVQIINVKIDSVAPPTLSLAITQPTCGQADGEATATTMDGWPPCTYTWSSSANTTNTETGLVEGSYSVTVTDSIGCTDSQTFQLIQLPPESDFTVANVCQGEQMSFLSQTTSGAIAWYWDFGDGNSSDLENPTYTYLQPGHYQVTLILSGGCMNDTVTHQASMYAPPVVSFSVQPNVITTRVDAQFAYTGTAATTFNWNFGDGQSSTEQNPVHLFGQEGFYDITLIATDVNGCLDSTTQTIEVMLQPVIYMPNAFMPQGTPANSRFKGYGLGITAAELSIFDRWGTLLYHSDDFNDILNSGWDGTYKGEPAPQDAYPYRLKASFYNNTSFEKLGTVTLIR